MSTRRSIVSCSLSDLVLPCSPGSTHNVTASTQLIMSQEFKIAAEVVDKVMVGKATWKE